MRDITNNKQYSIDFDFEKNINNISPIVLNNGDYINIPAILPFNKEFYEMHFNYIKKLINNNKIKCIDDGTFSIVLEFNKLNTTDYNDWVSILTFAKKNNLQFKINEKTEYNPKEMKNYIDKFCTLDIKGRKKFIFEEDSFFSNNNPFIPSENDPDVILDIEKICLHLDDQIEDTIKWYLERCNSKKIILVSKEGNFEQKHLNYAKRALETLKEFCSGGNKEIYFGSRHHYYTSEEFKRLLKFEKYCKEKYDENYELKFHSGSNFINKTQILNANNKISSIVNYLKQSKLSPYEKILYVHKLLAEKEYLKNHNADQDPYAALNSRSIVCITYCSIFKAIFDELNDSNIKVEIQLLNYLDEKESSHAINCVYLKDKKYNIEGYYDLDITINSSKDTLNYFMVPAGDAMLRASHKRTIKVPYNSSIYIKRICYFTKRNLHNLDGIDEQIDQKTIKNTYNFLNTSIGNKLSLFSKKNESINLFKTVNNAIEKTSIIPLDTTKQALKNVFVSCFGKDEETSNKLANNIIIKTIYNSIYYYIREECKNEFAKKSLTIEKGNFPKNNQAKKRI